MSTNPNDLDWSVSMQKVLWDLPKNQKFVEVCVGGALVIMSSTLHLQKNNKEATVK